ncbi:hypothetical protein Golob_002532 [Gossypium lobatum]|uniref:Uncharacterized protein n=1 Tax=Gossypium lobatum TaxID=34289 RepID=A0A7J8N5P0_9ROSI|nr:hypothetical protein [Gossypium lobatum]
MRSSKRCSQFRRKVLVKRGRKIRRNGMTAEPVRTSIERKLRQLQRMLQPCCPGINMETLFQRTADYIFLLEAKLNGNEKNDFINACTSALYRKLTLSMQKGFCFGDTRYLYRFVLE